MRGSLAHPRRAPPKRPHMVQAVMVYDQQPAFPALQHEEACEPGLYANWVRLQESSRVETSPTSLRACRSG